MVAVDVGSVEEIYAFIETDTQRRRFRSNPIASVGRLSLLRGFFSLVGAHARENPP